MFWTLRCPGGMAVWPELLTAPKSETQIKITSDDGQQIRLIKFTPRKRRFRSILFKTTGQRREWRRRAEHTLRIIGNCAKSTGGSFCSS
jgi:hypothetical protein